MLIFFFKRKRKRVCEHEIGGVRVDGSLKLTFIIKKFATDHKQAMAKQINKQIYISGNKKLDRVSISYNSSCSSMMKLPRWAYQHVEYVIIYFLIKEYVIILSLLFNIYACILAAETSVQRSRRQFVTCQKAPPMWVIKLNVDACCRGNYKVLIVNK